jgi:hypothetical protein
MYGSVKWKATKRMPWDWGTHPMISPSEFPFDFKISTVSSKIPKIQIDVSRHLPDPLQLM